LRPADPRALLAWFSAAARAQQPAGIDARLHQPLPVLAASKNDALRTALELEQHGFATAAFVVLTQLRRELPNDAEIVARQQIESDYGRAAFLEHEKRTDAALVAVAELLQRAPLHRGARMLRASIWGERGEIETSVAAYRDIVESIPHDATAHSAWLIAMQHDPNASADEIFESHREWSRKFMTSPPRVRRPDNEMRRLRVGWLSPRFFSGLVATFFLETLKHFGRDVAEHVLYDSGTIEDDTTANFQSAADEYAHVAHLDDVALGEKMRADRIDVLVELSGHSPGNRLRALAARPASVQMTWLDYFHSTGTAAVDVLIGDAVLCPPVSSPRFTERVALLPSGRLCYWPPSSAPPVSLRDDGPIRFCSFNRIDKLNDDVLRCWSRILAALPESRLRLKARGFDGADDRAHFLARCERADIAASRLELTGYGTHGDVLSDYRNADIALDPFPFSGCATSFDALWMGVPVITKPGDTMVSRQTASILHAIGLDDGVANDIDDYVAKTVALASAPDVVRMWRHSLRERMAPRVCDPKKNARELEHAVRDAWQAQCRGEFARTDSD
jgi:protein O-GlcNAc transferase